MVSRCSCQSEPHWSSGMRLVSRNCKSAVGVAAIVLVTLVAMVVLVEGRGSDDSQRIPRDLRKFVEETRQRAYSRVPSLFVTDRSQLVDALKPALHLNSVNEVDEALRLLGIVPVKSPRLSDSLDDYLRRQLHGFYRVADGSIWVDETLPGPVRETIIVEELTHAIDLEAAGLGPASVAFDGVSFSEFRIATEGSANFVALRFLAEMSPRERLVVDQFVATAREGGGSGLPAALDYAYGYATRVGPEMIRQVVATGGQGSLDQLLADSASRDLAARGDLRLGPPGVTSLLLATAGFEDAVALGEKWRSDSVSWSETDRDAVCLIVVIHFIDVDLADARLLREWSATGIRSVDIQDAKATLRACSRSIADA